MKEKKAIVLKSYAPLVYDIIDPRAFETLQAKWTALQQLRIKRKKAQEMEQQALNSVV